MHNSRQLGTNVEPPKMSDKILFLNGSSSVYDEPLAMLNAVLPGLSLSNVQELVFCQSWQGKAYSEIATTSDYDSDYLKDVGYRLWNILTKELGERVTKNNFRSVFRRHYQLARGAQQPLNVLNMPHLTQENGFYASASVRPTLTNLSQAPQVSLFEGRLDELALLERWIKRDDCRLVGIFGLAGVGKTSLAVKLTELLADSFNCVIWRSLRNAPPFPVFIQELLGMLLPADARTTILSIDEQVTLLVEQLQNSRCLLIIDGWASILSGEQGVLAGRYRPGYEHYGQLLRQIGDGRHQSTLILTSREKPIGLVFMEGEALPVRSLRLQGLARPVAVAMLRRLGLPGTPEALEVLAKKYSGNPLALKAATRTILDLFEGNVLKFLDQGTMVYGDIRQILEQQLVRLSASEQQLMLHLAQHSGWVSFADLVTGLSLELTQDSILESLESLHRRSLLQRKSNHFMLIEMLRETMLNFGAVTIPLNTSLN